MFQMIEEDRKLSDPRPLVFVYLGENFPHYAIHSANLALETSNAPIVVLAECAKPMEVSQTIAWIQISDFYRRTDFGRFVRATALPTRFREGFWLKTAERFFVLREYMRHSDVPALLHGELDCLFFDLSSLAQTIDKTGKLGVFLPRETESRVIASLVYVNSLSALVAMCEFILSNPEIGNEMEILGALPFEEESLFFALPSTESLYPTDQRRNHGGWSIVPDQPDFVVDGAAMGRWLFGVDPRNTGGRGTKNRIQRQKYVAPFDLPLGELSFHRPSKREWELRVSHKALRSSRRIVALHVHSKIHRDLNLRRLDQILRRLEVDKATTIIPVEPSFIWTRIRRVARQLSRIIRSHQLMVEALMKVRSKKWRKTVLRRIIDL